MPIRLGGGTVVRPKDLASIRLGDGTALFSQVPNSVIHQYRGRDFTTSTWTNSVGSADISINGASVTTLNGKRAASGDGVDDFGKATIPRVGNLQKSAVEFSMQTTSSGNGIPFGVNNSPSTGGTVTFNPSLNFDANFNQDPGNINIQLSDGTDLIRFAATTSPNLNDGDVHKVSIVFVDTASNDVRLIIDGSQVNITFSAASGPQNFGNLSDDFGFFARTDGGTPSDFSEISFGIFRFHDRPISKQTI